VKDLFDWRVPLREISAQGLQGSQTANAEERQELARVLDIASCERLAVDYKIQPMRSGLYRLTGRILADVVQPCVITLEPVTQHIDEALDIELRPTGMLPEAEEGEQDILQAPDVEPIEDDAVNVGLIVLEHLSTTIDPYPRLPGAELDSVAASAGQGANPFAVLKKLKDQG
jgi:uncharacterized metal-binding protein YceD (DUF177 family)